MICSMKHTILRIALLDDKEFGKYQIRNALPSELFVEIVWFPCLPAFRKNGEYFDLLFLDYYLDNDNVTSDMIFDEVRPRAKTIIAFSSSASANKKLLECGAEYAIDKVWQDKNAELENLFLEIF